MRINWDRVCELLCAVLSSSFDCECFIVVVCMFFTVLTHLQVFLKFHRTRIKSYSLFIIKDHLHWFLFCFSSLISYSPPRPFSPYSLTPLTLLPLLAANGSSLSTVSTINITTLFTLECRVESHLIFPITFGNSSSPPPLSLYSILYCCKYIPSLYGIITILLHSYLPHWVFLAE